MAAVTIVATIVTSVGCGGAAGDGASAPGATTTAPKPKPLPTASPTPEPTSTVKASGTGLAPAHAPEIPYPDPEWPTATPESQGLSTTQLDAAADVADANNSYCLLVVRHATEATS